MSNAKDYPDTIEEIACKLYSKMSDYDKKKFNLVTNYRPYELLDTEDQQCYRDLVISFLNATFYSKDINQSSGV